MSGYQRVRVERQPRVEGQVTFPRVTGLLGRLFRVPGQRQEEDQVADVQSQGGGNPYERRHGGARLVADHDAGVALGPGFGTVPHYGRPSELQIEDLEAIAARGRMRGRADAELQHSEELMSARRAAWDEGREAGSVAGSKHTLDQAELHHGADVHNAIERGHDVLRRLDTDPRKVNKAELATRLDSTVRLLRLLVDSHHSGFEKLPF